MQPPKKIIIVILLLTATAFGALLKPHIYLAAPQSINLNVMIPQVIGEWRVDPDVIPLQVSPDVQATLSKVYDQTLSRTYINPLGQRVMLSIAYGGDQSRGVQAHKPETCYAAQGFNVELVGNKPFLFAGRSIKARRLVGKISQRIEPITYWMRVGDTTVYGGLGQTLKRVELGLKGYVPDGLLFRVSSIGQDRSEAFDMQQNFVKSLLENVDESTQKLLIGNK